MFDHWQILPGDPTEAGTRPYTVVQVSLLKVLHVNMSILRQCLVVFKCIKHSQVMVDQKSFSFGFKVNLFFSQNRGTDTVNILILLLKICGFGLKLFIFLQDTRKRKGLKEGLPDLTQYLDKL